MDETAFYDEALEENLMTANYSMNPTNLGQSTPRTSCKLEVESRGHCSCILYKVYQLLQILRVIVICDPQSVIYAHSVPQNQKLT